MERIEQCEACGANKIIYRKHLRAAEVRGLYLLLETSQMLGRPVRFSEIGPLSHQVYCNLAMAALWDLIRHDAQDACAWELTPLGLAWLAGKTAIAKYRWTYRGELHDPPLDEAEQAIQQVMIWEVDEEFRDKASVLAEARNWSELHGDADQLEMDWV